MLPIPDDLAQRLGAGGDLARQALEAFAVKAYRADRLTSHELRRLLGFGTCTELDGFRKAREVDEAITVAESERDRQDLAQLLNSAT